MQQSTQRGSLPLNINNLNKQLVKTTFKNICNPQMKSCPPPCSNDWTAQVKQCKEREKETQRLEKNQRQASTPAADETLIITHKHLSFTAFFVCPCWPTYAALAALFASLHRFAEDWQETQRRPDAVQDLRSQPDHFKITTLVLRRRAGEGRWEHRCVRAGPDVHACVHKLTSSFGDAALSCAQHLRC